MYSRVFKLEHLLKESSLFLFGPRQTGKTTLLKRQFSSARFFNLLEADSYRELSARPELLRQQLTENDKLVIVDEIKKLPSLLDEVHNLIELRRDSLAFLILQV